MSDVHDVSADQPLPPEVLAAYVVPDPPAGFADRVLARISDRALPAALASGPASFPPPAPDAQRSDLTSNDPSSSGHEPSAPLPADLLPADLLDRYHTPGPPPGFADSMLRVLAGESLVRQPSAPRSRSLPAPARGPWPLTWKLTAAAAAAVLVVLAGQALLEPRPETPRSASASSLRVTPRVARGSVHRERFHVPAPPGPLEVFFVAAPAGSDAPRSDGRR